VDYRDLNKSTVKIKFSIPLVDDFLDELKGFTNLRTGYNQIRMNIGDVSKTTFKKHGGHYEYLVMLFELTTNMLRYQIN